MPMDWMPIQLFEKKFKKILLKVKVSSHSEKNNRNKYISSKLISSDGSTLT